MVNSRFKLPLVVLTKGMVYTNLVLQEEASYIKQKEFWRNFTGGKATILFNSPMICHWGLMYIQENKEVECWWGTWTVPVQMTDSSSEHFFILKKYASRKLSTGKKSSASFLCLPYLFSICKNMSTFDSPLSEWYIILSPSQHSN